MIFLDEDNLKAGNYFIPIDGIRSDIGEEYEINEWIGRGGNAAVYSCVEAKSGTAYAIKFQLSLSEKRIKRFYREIQLIKKVTHEHLIKYVDHGVASCQKKNKKKIDIPFVVMELAESNLFDYVMNPSTVIPYEIYISQFKGLSEGLGTLHSLALHRDIKPENILIVGEKWVLSDYGLCAFLEPWDGEELTDESNLGPRYWMSPEANNRYLGCGDNISKASDVFQLSAVFWFVVNSKHPSGILRLSDWTGPSKLFKPIYFALQHEAERRPQDGGQLFQLISEAVFD